MVTRTKQIVFSGCTTKISLFTEYTWANAIARCYRNGCKNILRNIQKSRNKYLHWNAKRPMGVKLVSTKSRRTSRANVESAFLLFPVAQALFGLAFLRLFFGAFEISFQAENHSCSSQLRRTKRAGWRVATFRFAAFFRSKTLFRFDSWSAWQHAANANRWALRRKHKRVREKWKSLSKRQPHYF